MQQALGNQAVGRMVQARLNINQPGDEYEQEADRIADTVMRMPAPQSDGHRLAVTPLTSHQAQRKCAECEEDKESGALQRKETGGTAAPPVVHDVLSSSGHPLDPAVRGFMEAGFGQDFSQVHVHTDSAAAESAEALNARAFTHGHHIVFGQGDYLPGTIEGRRLIAHELAHVVQQASASSVLPQNAPTAGPLVQRATNETGAEQKETCDKELWQVISRAVRHGKQALRYAIGELSPLQQETARATFKQYFGPDTDTAVAGVKGTLEAIEVLLAERQNRSEGRFRCAVDGSKECPESRIASTDSKDKVTFCPDFFATDRTDGDRASTLIHEGAHSALGTSNVDIYDDQPIYPMLSGVAGQSGEVGEVARRNPDSLAHFALALFGEKKPAYMPEQPTRPTYNWQGFGAETGPAEQQTIYEAIAWLRQWLYWAVYDLQSFKDDDTSRGQIELDRIGRLVKQFGLEGHLERSLTTLHSLEDKLEGSLEIFRVANDAGDGGIRWHDKREEWAEAIKAKDPNRATEIRQQHKSDWVEVSDGFFSLGSTSERVNGLLDALGPQFETFRLVEYVRRNADNKL